MPSGIYERTEEHRRILKEAHKGRKLSEEHKRKISKALIGRVGWSGGLTKEIDKRIANISKAMEGKKRKPFTEETKKRISESRKGVIFSEERNKKISQFMLGNKYSLGNHHSKETRQKMSVAHKGYHHSKETRSKISKAKKGEYTGSASYHWRGGISFEPYSSEFNKQLKELIRNRDNYQCQLCRMPECENIQKLSIHHIDYNKYNSLPSNLISLCRNCHTKVNFSRKYWEEYFKHKLGKCKIYNAKN